MAKRCGLNSPKVAPLYCSIMCTSYKCGNLRKGFTAIKMFPVTYIYFIEGKPGSKVVQHSRFMKDGSCPSGLVPLATRLRRAPSSSLTRANQHPLQSPSFP